MSKLFVIQNMDTGMKMPAGGTHAEFSNDKAPRLFTRRSAATNALESWLMGYWCLHYADEDMPLPEPMDSPSNAKRETERRAMNIQVREVRLEVVAP